MKLSELRNYVRTQTETTSGELPDTTIDLYLQEAFNRTIAMENQWPFLEKTWELTQTAGQVTMPIPSDMNVPAITGMFTNTESNREYRIELMSHVQAKEAFGFITDTAQNWYMKFSPWSGELHLWPKVPQDENRTWYVTGFRLPTDWIAQGPDGEPDCDSRLQQPFAHYAVALAYAQQEDEQLESTYMSRWQRDVEFARSAIMEPSQDRPLVMGPHIWSRIHPHVQRPWGVVDLTGRQP